MKIEKIVVGPLEENCYVLTNEKKEALVIDPGAEPEKILDFLQPYKVVEILVTHFHFDHIGALEELETHYNIKRNTPSSSFSYEVLSTPGHTDDSLSFYFPSLHSVFVGDFIFENGIGRTNLGGNDKDMCESITKFLNTFDLSVTIYPGHGPSTTLAKEQKMLKALCKM